MNTARVAVVDDDPDVRELVQEILLTRGYSVASYEDVGQARAGLCDFEPDLMVVDVELPDGSGLDLVRGTQGRDGRPVPAIVLSSLKGEGDIVRGFVSGAADYLTKPFKQEELLARCAIHLARRGNAVEEPEEVQLPTRDGLAFGRYRLERMIGRGGYGAVYLARDTFRNNARVALKVLGLLVGEQMETRLRFIREAYTAGSVTSKRVAAIHDVGAEAGRQYYAMDFIDGPSLHGHVRFLGALDESETRLLAQGLLEGLVAFEGASLVHRDLKPDNIIIRGRRLSDPVIVDFGLAKRPFDKGVTRADVLIGTPAYLPPEVINGVDADARSDLYQLGCVLRYALDGEDPYPGLSGIPLMKAIVSQELPPPAATLTPSFLDFLGRLTARDPASRPASANVALQWLASLDLAPTRRTRRPPPPLGLNLSAPPPTR